MKILLLGEFSAFHMNLKEGLNELGHEALVAGWGDGFKKVPVDISFDSSYSGSIAKLDRRLKVLKFMFEAKGFDIVQLINPYIFKNKLFPTLTFYEQLKKSNGKLLMLATGDDPYYWQVARKVLRYGPFEDSLKFDFKSESCLMQSASELKFQKKVVQLSDGVIPTLYDYAVGYFGCKKLKGVIPVPINTKKIVYRDNTVKNKIVIFHGLNRYGAKGTRYVEEAFSILSKRYPNELELIIDGKMPLNKYLEVLEKANVVIDQVNTYSLGINGVYALAMGKVVMGGAEPESLRTLGVQSSPVINILPNASNIVNEIERLIENRSKIAEVGFKSRKFAESVHDCVKVAEQYVNTWKSV